jgi:uncharacterized damage-inducible protein DinB
MSQAAARPRAAEYAQYYDRYVSLVPEGDVVATLERQIGETLALLRSLPEERAGHRYAEGKWSIRELVGHINDAERIFAYRALRIARGDATPLAGFDQDTYVPAGNFDARTLADLVDELEAIRRSTLALLRPLSDEAWDRSGVASESPVTVRALAYIIAGHERAHMGVLRERYL